VSLDNSEAVGEETGLESGEVIPRFSAVSGLKCLHAHVAEAASQMEEVNEQTDGATANEIEDSKQVWDLMMALWGKLEEPLDTVQDEEGGIGGLESHEVTMRRKENLSSWLEKAVQSTAEEAVREAKARGNLPGEMLGILSGNRLEAVCDRAQGQGDHYGALMMSCGGSGFSGNLILKYLDLMQYLKADPHLHPDRLRLYAMISGTPVWHGSSDKLFNTCDGLEWQRALAVTLWFHTPPTASVSDALTVFEDAFQGLSQFGAYASPPLPEYFQDRESTDQVYDIRYHLLKLYSDRGHPLEKLVTPTTHGSGNHLDHRLGWFLAQVLQSLGYHHMAVQRSDQHHLEFASQLECLGLWHWAVFVLLHLNDAKHRKAKVQETLGRHVRLDCEISAEREEFVHENLYVPLSWIAKAKAVRASFEGRLGDQAWYLIQSEEWNAAHEVVVKEIAPDSIIGNNSYEYFYDLLKELEKHKESITSWNIRGAIYYDFISVDLEVNHLVAERDETKVGYYMEKLRPQVTNICSRINSLDTSNAKNRLCQAEIAKKVAHLMRAVVSLQHKDDLEMDSYELSQQLAQLPLPEDYELQELRTLTRIYMKELLTTNVNS